MFLTGTLPNVATVLAGTVIGLLLGARMPARMQEGLAIKSLLDGVASIASLAVLALRVALRPRLQRLSDLWRANVQHDVTLTH